MMLKCISIREPWGSLIREGKKTIETRTWNTKYRGKILLHASAKPESEISGKIFAIADLVDCHPMTKEDEEAAQCEIYPKAHSWVLKNVIRTNLMPLKGQLGLFDVEVELEGFEENDGD